MVIHFSGIRSSQYIRPQLPFLQYALTRSAAAVYVRPGALSVVLPRSPILRRAARRYLEDGLFFPYQVSRFLRSLPHSPELPAQTTTECRDTPTPSPQLKELVVEVNGLVEKVDEGQKGAEDGEEEDFPQFGMEEGYELDVWAEEGIGRARLRGESVWGALRGLETFSQLMWPRADGCAYALAGLPLRIRDRPALPWRGLLLDSSRHFIPVQAIRRVLDACAYAKINTYLVPALLLPPPPPDLRRLHWHLSDTQSFPLLLSAVPELAQKGAYAQEAMYSEEEVRSLVRYARDRGIRVVPEVDMPGHTLSWQASHAELFVNCSDLNDDQQALDVLSEEPLRFVARLLDALLPLFPDRFFHLGADEVDTDCYLTEEGWTRRLREAGLPLERSAVERLLFTFLRGASGVLARGGKRALAWADMVFASGDLNADNRSFAALEVWREPGDLSLIAAARRPVLLAADNYLDHLDADWRRMWRNCPLRRIEDPALAEWVWGGEACAWSEGIDCSNLEVRLWPRAAAVAEALWSCPDTGVGAEGRLAVARRLRAHRCRLLSRGIAAEPVGGPEECSPLLRPLSSPCAPEVHAEAPPAARRTRGCACPVAEEGDGAEPLFALAALPPCIAAIACCLFLRRRRVPRRHPAHQQLSTRSVTRGLPAKT